MKYSDLRIIVIRENWTGCTGISAASALSRLGAGVYSLTEAEFVPVRWKSTPMRALGRLLRPAAVREFNRHLRRTAENFRPHLLLSTKGTFVSAGSVRALKAAGVRCFNFFPDVSYHTHGRYLREAVAEYDWIFSTKSFGCADFRASFGASGAGCSYLPHGWDADVHRPRAASAEEQRAYGCDVSFIGAWSRGKGRTLTEFVERLPEVDLKIWGEGWRNVETGSPLERFVQGHAVTGSSYAAAIGCSKINLGLVHERVRGASSGDQITSRTFHIPASGGFLLHRRTADLLDLFEEDADCAAFEDARELAEKVTLFLRDEARRKQIAERGRRMVEAAHSWDHRARTILDRYFEMSEQRAPEAAAAAKC